MLCDDIVQDGGEYLAPEGQDQTDPLLVAQRFVLSPLVVETANHLCADRRAITRSRGHYFFPAEKTWIEWYGEVPWSRVTTRMGVLFVGMRLPDDTDDDALIWHGSVFLYLPPIANAEGGLSHIPLRFACILNPMPAIYSEPKILAPLPTREDIPKRHRAVREVDGDGLAAWLCAVLALINTPRLSKVIEHDHAKQNKSRIKGGKPPLLTWGEVTLAVDRGELGIGEQIVRTGQRARHHVRTHLRLRFGKVQIVRPHWRGNRLIGVHRTRYAVTRAEDEAGAWKGGVLPGPRIIKSRFDAPED